MGNLGKIDFVRLFAAAAIAAWTLGAGTLWAQAVSPRAFRLFLIDGTEVATHGEASRVGDEVVAMVPIGLDRTGAPTLQAVTLPASRIDWPRTEAYLQAVRLAQYAAATGDRDYAAFTADVAATLDRVSSTADPLARIAMVEAVRRRLADWPREHYGYRASEATAMLSMLDEVLIGLRAAAGQREFAFALAAGAVPAPVEPPPLRTAPTLQAVVTQALGLAAHVDSPRERETLLRGALELVESNAAAWDRDWRRETTRAIERRLDAERRISRDYDALRSRVVARAARFAAAADVRALLALRADTARRDERLGRQRPAEITGLLAHLDAELAATRQYRLLLDRWEARRDVLGGYTAAIVRVLGTADPVIVALDDIRTLSGPPLGDINRASAILKGVDVAVLQMTVPEEGRELHGLLRSGLQMAATALERRRDATLSGELSQAWQASAAAAGALMVVERLQREAAQLPLPPTRASAAASASR